MVAARNPKLRVPYESVLDKQTIEELKGDMDNGDYEDVVKGIESHDKIAAKPLKPDIHGGAKGKAAGKAAAKVAPVPKKPVVKGLKRVAKDLPLLTTDISLEKAREFMPVVKGASLVKQQFHQRWQVYYPKDSPPFSASRVWDEDDMMTSLMFVLKWVWDLHTAASGEQCPWNLE